MKNYGNYREITDRIFRLYHGTDVPQSLLEMGGIQTDLGLFKLSPIIDG